MSEKGLCKSANGEAMSGAADAVKWANELVRREARGPGDYENAMRRLEHRYGISWRVFWALRYRPPRDVMTGIYVRLREAYLAECDRQEGLLRHGIAIAKAKGLSAAPAVRAAEDLLGVETAPLEQKQTLSTKPRGEKPCLNQL